MLAWMLFRILRFTGSSVGHVEASTWLQEPLRGV